MTAPHDILRQYWGYDSFRGIQEDIIQSILEGHDTLGLMPTGGGKSITFQVPTLALEGLCIVVTPLIALMRDQVNNLRRRDIFAETIYSGMSPLEIDRVYAKCIYGKTKFLYVSPERLESATFLQKLRHMHVSLITVDEAHCISQWGYDFRPAYLRIHALREALPGVPVLALTATATPAVVDDICQQLHFGDDARLFRMSFERSNLSYVVRQADDKIGQLIHILQRVNGSAIVYMRNREGTREVAQHLEEAGISALHYHAGLTSLTKDTTQQRWQDNEVRVIVATNAFGMGIDKPDVRLVVHLDIPDSLEAYFQEAGRAGRDGNASWAVLLYNRGDITQLNKRVAQEFPPKEFCAQIYEELAYFLQIAIGEGTGHNYEFHLPLFCRNFRHYPNVVESALKLLTQAGYITYTEDADTQSRLMMITQRDDLYYLRHLSPWADKVIRALLRLYSGLFSQYIFIEEERLANEAGLTAHAVYDTLIELTQQRILNYVPRKNVPRITYERRRVDQHQVCIPANVYENRLKNYKDRLNTILHYVQSQDECRSQIMLRYFGQDDAKECGRCDVCCTQHNTSSHSPQ